MMIILNAKMLNLNKYTVMFPSQNNYTGNAFALEMLVWIMFLYSWEQWSWSMCQFQNPDQWGCIQVNPSSTVVWKTNNFHVEVRRVAKSANGK